VLQILYYDGKFDDARLNVALATTAAAAGAAVANYVEATQLIRVS
jgi:glycerol-3-phosphate dehydrogenase